MSEAAKPRLHPGGRGARRRAESPRHEAEARKAAQQARHGHDAERLSRTAAADPPQGLTGPGERLANPMRARLESVFGADLSALRIHSNPAAHRLADAADARAFAAGPSLVFGAGAFRPTTGPGFELLAHETAHALQQSGQPRPDGRLHLVATTARPGTRVQRDPKKKKPADPPALHSLGTGDNAWPSLKLLYATVKPFGGGDGYLADATYDKEVAEIEKVIGGDLATFGNSDSAQRLAAWVPTKAFTRFRAECLAFDALQISDQVDAALTMLQKDPRLETSFYNKVFQKKVKETYNREFWAQQFLDGEGKSPYVRSIWKALKQRLLDLALYPDLEIPSETPLADEIAYLHTLKFGGDELLLNLAQVHMIIELGQVENAVLAEMRKQFKDGEIGIDLGIDPAGLPRNSPHLKMTVRANVLSDITNRHGDTISPVASRLQADLKEPAGHAYQSALIATDMAAQIVHAIQGGGFNTALTDKQTDRQIRLTRSKPFTAYLDGLAALAAKDAKDGVFALAPQAKATATGATADDQTADTQPAAFLERMLGNTEFNSRWGHLAIQGTILAQQLGEAFQGADPDTKTDDRSRPGPRTSVLMLLLWSDWFQGWVFGLKADPDPDHVALQRYVLSRALYTLGAISGHTALKDAAGQVALAQDAGESYAIIPKWHFEVDPRGDYHDLPKEAPVIAEVWSTANGQAEGTPHVSEFVTKTSTLVDFYDLQFLVGVLPKLADEITAQTDIARANAKLPQGAERELPPADSVQKLIDSVAETTPKPKRWISPDGVLVRNSLDPLQAIKVQDKHPAVDAMLGFGGGAGSQSAPPAKWKGQQIVRSPNVWSSVYYWTLPPLDGVRDRLRKIPAVAEILDKWRNGKNKIVEPANAVFWLLQLFDWATTQDSVASLRAAIKKDIGDELKEKQRDYKAQLRRLTTLNRIIRLDYIRDRLSLFKDSDEQKSDRDIAYDANLVDHINRAIKGFQRNVLPKEDRDIQTVALMIQAAPQLLRVVKVRTGFRHVQSFFEPVALALAMATGTVVFGVSTVRQQKKIVDDPAEQAGLPKGKMKPGFATKMLELGVEPDELTEGIAKLREVLAKLDESRRKNQALFVLDAQKSEGLNTALASTRLKPGSERAQFVLALPYRSDVYESDGEGHWLPAIKQESPFARAATARQETDEAPDKKKVKEFWEYNQIVYTDHPIFYNIQEIYHDFKYMPAYKASGAAGRKGKLTTQKGNPIRNGTKLLRISFSRIYKKDNEPRFAPERTVIIRAGDHKLLELMTNVVDHQSRSVQLTELANMMEAGANLILDLLEFIPGVGQAIMVARLGANIVEMLANLDWDEIKAELIESPQQALDLIQSGVIANLTGDAVWRFLLGQLIDPSPATERMTKALAAAKERSEKKREKQKAKQRLGTGKKKKSEKYKKFLNSVSSIGWRFEDAFGRARQRLVVGVNSAQGNIAGSPVLFKHLSRMPQYLVWLELLGDIVDATGLLEGTNAPGDKAAAKKDRSAAQSDFAVGGLDFNKAIGAMMSPLTEFELPAEVVPTDLLVEIVIEMTIGNVRNRKVKILYEALRLTGGIELISREVSKRLIAGTAADPNKYWQQDILPKIKDPIESGRNDLVEDIYKTLNALIPSARLKAPKPPEISVGTTPFSMEDPPEAEPFLRAGDPIHPDMAPRPEHSGLPLPERLQARLQSSFGHDLGHVRLHRDREADDFVRGTGAEALTSGSHIYLRDGLSPDQGEGAHILRHEVAHVLQQTGAQPLGQTRAGPVDGRPGRGVRVDPYREAAAERMAVQASDRSATDDGPLPVDGTGERVLAPFEKGEMVKLLHKLTRNAHPTAFAKSVSSGPMLDRGGQTAKTRATALMTDLRTTLSSSATKRSKSMLYGEDAIGDIKAHVSKHLGDIKNSTVLRMASSAIVELPAARQTGRNKYELLSQNFLNVVEGYLFSQTGVRLTIDADNKNPNKVESVAIRGLHLGAITANTGLYTKIKDAYTVVHGLEFDRLRAYLRARFPLPHPWKRSNDLLLDPDDLKKIAAATKISSKLDPKNLPRWSTYANPTTSEKIALRVANHGNLTGDDAATERESHHLPQFLLVEFYTGQNANVNIFGKSGDYWTPGFRKGSNPQMTRPGRKSVYTGFKSLTHDLNFADFKTESNRGSGMPAISLAAVTHQKGGLHLNQERSWDASKETNSPSTQGFTMFNRHREHLIAEVKGQPALKKNDPAAAKSLDSAAGFRAMVDEATGGTDSQKDALRNATGDAIKKTYALFIQRLKPALETALIDHELPYYAGLAAQHPDYADTPGNAYRPPDPSKTEWVKTVIGAIRTRNETAYAGWSDPGAWS